MSIKRVYIVTENPQNNLFCQMNERIILYYIAL